MRTRLTTALLALIAVASLTGCGQQAPTMTLDEAKTQVFAVEDEVLALVPDAAIAERFGSKQHSTVLFPCDGGYIWPGSAEVALVDDLTMDGILDEVVEIWTDRAEWDVVDSGPQGDPRDVVLTHENGLVVTVVGLKSNTRLSVGSFSACFDLEGEYDPFAEY